MPTPGQVNPINPALFTPPENSGIKLVSGFQASVFAENLGKARHIVVDKAGTVFVKLDKLKDGKGIVELNDTNNDGQADQTMMFGNYTARAWPFTMITSMRRPIHRSTAINSPMVR